MSVEEEEEESNVVKDARRPRPYQIELLEKAKLQNSIVFIGTGAGKTFIAAMMIKEFGHQLRDGFKKTVFLVNSVALVGQQSEFLKTNTCFTCASYCGADNVDNWNVEKWKEEIDKHQILVMVHQVFLDLLQKSFFSLSRVNLLIIDEVHHTVKNTPYNQIMTRYHDFKKLAGPADLPHILGLTASIVMEACDKDKFIRLKAKLEENTDCQVITTEEKLANMLKFVTSPKEKFVTYALSSSSKLNVLDAMIDEGCKKIESLREEKERRSREVLEDIAWKHVVATDRKKVKSVTRLLQNLKEVFATLGIYAMEQLVNLYKEDLLLEKINLADEPFHRDIYKIANDVSEEIRDNVRATTHHITDECDRLAFLSSDKVLTLLKILQDEVHKCQPSTPEVDFDQDISAMKRTHSPNMTAIIFVQMRQTAAVLCHILSTAAKLNPRLTFLRVGVAMGQQAKTQFKTNMSMEALKAAKEEREKLNETLTKFRSGELNCIVSTSVLEEGMDVKTCNLIVRFDQIPEFRSYVQSKGRARAKPSKYIIMVSNENERDVRGKIEEFRTIEENAIDLCHRGSEEDDCADEEIDEYLVNPKDPMNSARVTSLTAIATVYHYVQALPSDKFTSLLPYFDYQKLKDMSGSARHALFGALKLDMDEVECVLHLPHLTPIIEPVVGPAKKNKILAKRAVALKVCQMLHKLRELDDHLQPIKRKMEIEEDDDACIPGEGTKKRREYYKKKVPDELTCLDFQKSMYLYKIHLVLDVIGEVQTSKRRKLYIPEEKLQKLGFILGAKLPAEALRPFHLFMYSGRVLVRVEMVKHIKALQEDDLRQIISFHELVFTDVLNLIPKWMTLDPKLFNKELVIVPILHDDINFSFLASLKRVPDPPSKPFKFNKHLYEDAVIIPKHRNMERCFVQEVLENMSPLSDFPKATKQTFQSHFKEEYGKVLTNLYQPLLRVSNADKKYDTMNNAIVTSKSVTDEANLLSDWILIPELVEIHKVPASMWYECQLLPFILNRITKIIQVGKLRNDFMLSAGLPNGQLYRDLLADYPLDFSLKHVPKLFEKLLKVPESGGKITCPTVDELLRSLTATGAGEAFDLEREEILGDSFLKYATSIFLFFKESDILDEGSLSTLRSRIVGNKHLFRKACDLKLYQIFTPAKFVPRKNWRPPRFRQPKNLEETLCRKDNEMREKDAKQNGSLFDLITFENMSLIASETDTEEALESIISQVKKVNGDKRKASGLEARDHNLISDKSLADAVESLIGCFLIESGQLGALKFMEFLGINLSADLLDDEDLPKKQKMSTGSRYWFSPPANAYHGSIDLGRVGERLDMLMRKIEVDMVEKCLGYSFREKSFMLQALTHCSYMQNKITNSLERLEFLGDAIVDYLVTCYLFTKFPKLTPGQVTDIRSALVNNNTFAKLAVNSKLHTQLLHSSSKVFSKIDEYATYLAEEAHHESGGQAVLSNLEMHSEEGCPILEDIEVPKVLGDVVEALLGAIFIDSGFDLQVVWRVFRQLFPEMDDVIKKEPKNHVKQLMERFPEKVQFIKKPRKKLAKGSYMLVKIDMNDDAEPCFFAGTGNNYQRAKSAAATCAIRELKKRGYQFSHLSC